MMMILGICHFEIIAAQHIIFNCLIFFLSPPFFLNSKTVKWKVCGKFSLVYKQSFKPKGQV